MFKYFKTSPFNSLIACFCASSFQVEPWQGFVCIFTQTELWQISIHSWINCNCEFLRSASHKLTGWNSAWSFYVNVLLKWKSPGFCTIPSHACNTFSWSAENLQKLFDQPLRRKLVVVSTKNIYVLLTKLSGYKSELSLLICVAF